MRASNFTILSHSPEEILRGLNDFSLDVGITYLDNEPIDGLVLPRRSTANAIACSCRNHHPLAGRYKVTWREAAQRTALPPNPRICRTGASSTAPSAPSNCRPEPALETNSVISLYSNVRLMGLASVMPHYILQDPRQ